MSANVEEMFRSLCNERGGVDALTVTQTAIARALATALCADAMNPTAIASLENLLPPAAGQEAPGHIDLSKCTDEDLAFIEGLHARAGVPGPSPEPGSDKATIAELLRMVDFWRANCAAAQRLQGIAEQAEQVAKRLENDAHMANLELREENARLQERLATVAATDAGVAKDPAAPETQPATASLTGKWHPDSRPSNVMDITNAPNFGPRNAALFDASDPSGRGRGLP